MGAAIEGNAVRGLPHLNLATLAVSVALLVGSLVFSRLLWRHEAEVDAESAQKTSSLALPKGAVVGIKPCEASSFGKEA